MDIVVFACVHNAGRSQMAAAFFNLLVDSRKAKAISAGTQPSDEVFGSVKDAMLEVGINLTEIKPKLLTSDLARGATYLITMGCKESCPFISSALMLDWNFDDPNGKEITEVRIIRNQIRAKVYSFASEKLWLP